MPIPREEDEYYGPPKPAAPRPASVGGVTKTWHTTAGPKARPEHQVLNGETVPMDSVFSNGLKYPGDPSTGNPRETAKCTCVMSIGGEVDGTPSYSDPFIDSRLQTGKITLGDEIGTGMNAPQWADVDGVQAVYKWAETNEITADRFVQWLNTEYEVGVDIPRTVVREVDGEFVQLTCKAPGKALAEFAEQGADAWFAEVSDAALVEEQRNMLFLDELTGNVDRTLGNILVTDSNHLIGIDHGLAMDAARLSDATAALQGIRGASELSPYLEQLGGKAMDLSPQMKSTLRRIIDDAENLWTKYGEFAEETGSADVTEAEQAIINMVERAKAMLEKGTL